MSNSLLLLLFPSLTQQRFTQWGSLQKFPAFASCFNAYIIWLVWMWHAGTHCVAQWFVCVWMGESESIVRRFGLGAGKCASSKCSRFAILPQPIEKWLKFYTTAKKTRQYIWFFTQPWLSHLTIRLIRLFFWCSDLFESISRCFTESICVSATL